MAKNRSDKHHADRLLARLVLFAESTDPIKERDRRLAAEVMGVGPFVELGDSRARVLDEEIDYLTPFRERLRQFIRAVVPAGGLAGRQVPVIRVGSLEFGAVPAGKSGVLLTIDGSTYSVLWVQTMMLLHEAGIGRLRRCECGRIFAKTGRREFCSSRCQNRVYMREMRRRNAKETRTRRR